MKTLLERFDSPDLFDDIPLSSVSPDKMLSIIPFLPVNSYIGTRADREAFIKFAKACQYRPAYMIKIVHRSDNRYRKSYTIISGVDTFQQAIDKCIFNYKDIHGFTPYISFIARLPTRLG